MQTKDSLKYEFLSKPDYGFVKVQLNRGQAIDVEASAMASMDTNVAMSTKMKGGVLGSLKRTLAGESMFINTFTAQEGPGELCIAPGAPGDVEHYTLEEGKCLFLQSSTYLASSPGVKIESKWGGWKGFFSGTGLFLVKATGSGDVFFNAYGGLIEIPVEDNYLIDTGYIVAFEESLQYEVKFLGGLKTSLFGGEGLVCQFKGKGKVWIQTRKVAPFVWWVWPFRPQKNRN